MIAIVKLEYYVYNNVRNLSGVIKKVQQFVQSLKQFNISGKVLYADPGLCGHLGVAKRVLFSKADIIIIRISLFSNILLFLPVLFFRFRGGKIIFDIPTPLKHTIFEIAMDSSDSIVIKFIKLVLILLNFPLSLYPANLILEYSSEAKYFKVPGKTKLIGNGIDTSAIPFREDYPAYNGKDFNVIAVSALAFWHGYDRLIESLIYYYKTYHNEITLLKKPKINLHIVGTGPELERLQSLTDESGLNKYVFFHGEQIEGNLSELFNNQHVAFGSLGIFRKRLSIASELKIREYLARGIPTVITSTDIDIDPDSKFVLQLPNNSSTIDLAKVIDWYLDIIKVVSPLDIRQFAERYLDYKTKINDILSGIGMDRKDGKVYD